MAEHRPPPGTDGTDPFERHIANAIAEALGERKVRLNDRRLIVLWLVVMLLFGLLATYVVQGRRNAESFERQIIANCYAFNRFISSIQATTAASHALTQKQIDQRVAFYDKAKQKCPPTP